MSEETYLLGADLFGAGEGQQYVTCLIGGEEYGIEALKVQEITGLPPITKVPHLPEFIKGVINLRGTVVPVVDLRLRFGLGSSSYDKETCIIVVRLLKRIMGVIVDAVTEVIQLPKESMDPTPDFGDGIKTEFMKGVGKIDKRLLVLLNLEKLFSDIEMKEMEVTHTEADIDVSAQTSCSAAGMA